MNPVLVVSKTLHNPSTSSKSYNGTWTPQPLYKLQRSENYEPFVYQKSVYTAKCTVVCNTPPSSIKRQSFSVPYGISLLRCRSDSYPVGNLI